MTEVTLKTPVTVLEKVYTTLTVSEPTFAEYEAAQKAAGSLTLPEHLSAFKKTLMRASTDVPIQVIQKLGISDFMRIWNLVEVFLVEEVSVVETELKKLI